MRGGDGFRAERRELWKFLKVKDYETYCYIRKGFIITEINNKAISTIEEINKIISSVKGGVYIGGIYPNGQAAYYAFGLDD